ncbi:MAG TPA: cytochrome c [Panacibacter sp.]|nr:cytochrome c [Panacibacter sp.]
MLKKILKWLGIVIGCLVLILIVFYAIAYFSVNSRANKVYSVKLQQLAIPDDSLSYAMGRHTAAIRGCLECHGSNLGGKVFMSDTTPIGVLYSANLTNGKGGINYADSDWVRALRHGLNKENKSVWFMPSQHTTAQLSNKELSALICFLKKQPPVDNVIPKHELKPLGTVLTFLDKFPLFPAEAIDHNATYADDVKAEVSAAYGKYLAISCAGCHGENYKGAPAGDPNSPPVPDLTSTGHLGKWSSDQFMAALRSGKTPEGKMLSDYMPWKVFGQVSTDDELKAIYLYLHSLN